MAWDIEQIWYHGSPSRLTALDAGSTITRDRDLARVFSHKPRLVWQCTDETGKRYIKHTGQMAGFLYRVAESVRSEDVYPHPHTTMEPELEWLTTRDLRVELLEPTAILPDEILSEQEIEELKRRMRSQEPTS